MADKVNPNLNESVRPGGFYRVEALSRKEEDATYVDAEGRPIPDEEVEKFKSQNVDKSNHAEEVSQQMPSGSALTPAAPLRAATNQQSVVDRNSGAGADIAQTTDAPPDSAGGTRGSL